VTFGHSSPVPCSPGPCSPTPCPPVPVPSPMPSLARDRARPCLVPPMTMLSPAHDRAQSMPSPARARTQSVPPPVPSPCPCSCPVHAYARAQSMLVPVPSSRPKSSPPPHYRKNRRLPPLSKEPAVTPTTERNGGYIEERVFGNFQNVRDPRFKMSELGFWVFSPLWYGSKYLD